VRGEENGWREGGGAPHPWWSGYYGIGGGVSIQHLQLPEESASQAPPLISQFPKREMKTTIYGSLGLFPISK